MRRVGLRTTPKRADIYTTGGRSVIARFPMYTVLTLSSEPPPLATGTIALSEFPLSDLPSPMLELRCNRAMLHLGQAHRSLLTPIKPNAPYVGVL